MPRVSSEDADTLAAQNSVEELKHLTPNSPFAKINDTYPTVLRNLEKLFNIIPKVADQQ